jgi:hypothetical protein
MLEVRNRKQDRQEVLRSVRQPDGPIRRWTCQNREQRILREFCAQ